MTEIGNEHYSETVKVNMYIKRLKIEKTANNNGKTSEYVHALIQFLCTLCQIFS